MKRSLLLSLFLASTVSCFVVGPSPKATAFPRSTARPAVAQDESTDVNPRTFGLALELDEGTRQSHSLAENSAFVTGFFKGLSTRDAFSDLVVSLYYVYDAMEGTLADPAADPRIRALDDPRLRRMDSLRRDLKYFYGDDWEASVPPPSPATEAYVGRILELRDDPDRQYLMIAHQYSRYLGDLFGGQMMRGMALRSLNLEAVGEEKLTGVDFYCFPEIPKVSDYITEWYSILNDVGENQLTKEQRQAIVDEANYVFTLNIGIFGELEGSPIAAAWKVAVSALKEKFANALGGK